MIIPGSNIAWIDVETTGLHAQSNQLLEIACIVTDSELNVLDETGFQSVVYYSKAESNFMRTQAVQFVRDMHDKTGLWEKLPQSGSLTLTSIDYDLVTYLEKFGEPNTMPVAGNSVRLDMNFMDQFLPRVSAHLDYHMRDVSTVAGFAEDWYGESNFEKRNDHTAMTDIRESIREMKHYREAIFRSVSETDLAEGAQLAQDFFDACEGDSGDAEITAGWALAEWASDWSKQKGATQ